MAGGVRIWRLCEPADALPLLRAERLSGPLPLPCCAAQVPRRLAPRAPEAADGVFGPLPGRACWIACGSVAALEKLASAWPGAGPALAETLARWARPPGRLRFADGACWEFPSRTRVMGILNVTPDSFSDGGRFRTVGAALERAAAMLEEGADLIDVGGESTRPGAAPVDAEEEVRRVVPVIEAIRREFPRARLSVDTRRAATARRALDAGADAVNDVSGLADPAMAPLVAARGCPVVVMHMRGTPETMQRDTHYEDLIGEVHGALERALETAREAGVQDDRIVVDPGVGFGKSAEGNEELLRHLSVLRGLGRPILVGASRKSFIGIRTGERDPSRRLEGSLAAAAVAVLEGAAIVRVHDVGPTRRALAVTDPLRRWANGGNRAR